MKRQIIRIDEDKCDGCGLCAGGCPEGALQIIDGKARLVSEITCDGLGACIGTCPRGAIEVEVREAAPYDEVKVIENILPMGENTLKAHLRHLHEHGQRTLLAQAVAALEARGVPVPAFRETRRGLTCPGSAPRELPRDAASPEAGPQPSRLTQWPVQLHLLSPLHEAFRKADLLLAADCVAYALGNFHGAWLAGKKLAIACPKLDANQELYLDKLVALMDEAHINTLTVMVMEVPCCGGLLRLVQSAAARAARRVPVKLVVVGIDGEIRREEWVG